MKAYEIIGEWKHNKTGQERTYRFVVLAEDNDNPMNVFERVFEIKGLMTCMKSTLRELTINTAIAINKDAIRSI